MSAVCALERDNIFLSQVKFHKAAPTELADLPRNPHSDSLPCSQLSKSKIPIKNKIALQLRFSLMANTNAAMRVVC